MGYNGKRSYKSLFAARILAIIFLSPIFFSCADSSLQVQNTHTTSVQNSGTTQALFSVHFINETVGYVVGDSGTILRTTNGGSTWANISYPTTKSLHDVFFLTADTGFVCGIQLLIGTTDSGKTWATLDVNREYTAIHFFDRMNGFVEGGSFALNGGITYFKKTTDGGKSWVLINSNLDAYGSLGKHKFSFINSSSGFTVLPFSVSYGGDPIGSVFRTNSGGASWDSCYQVTDSSYTDWMTIQDVQAINSTDVYLCGDTGIVVKSTDFGFSWQRKETGILSSLYSISFPSPTVGYVVGDRGVIIKTSDAGEHWIEVPSGTTEPLFKVYCPTSNVGYAVGWGGKIIKFY